MKLKFSLSEAKLTRLHTHIAVGLSERLVSLSCCLMHPNLAKALCPHLEVSVLATL